MRCASALLLLLLACNSNEVGPIDLKEQPSGTTVRAVKVRSTMTTIVGLTTQTETITSDSPKNSVSGVFEVRVEEPPPANLQIASTTTCRVGDFTIAQPLTWNGSIAHTPVGQTREFAAQYMPSAAALGVPSVCEFSEFAGSPRMGPAEAIEPVRLATACWRPDSIVEGPCPADALPRTAVDEFLPVSIPALVSSGALVQGKGYGVPFYFVVTANTDQPERALVKGRIACSVDGKTFEGSANALTQIDQLAAGESIGGHGYPFTEEPLPTRPQWCTVELEYTFADIHGPPTSIASWCIRDGAATPGACE
jgi:hypothetical protein